MLKKAFKLALFSFIITVTSLFANEAKVLVVIPNNFLREALVLRLQLEGYHNIREESCEDLLPNAGQIALLIHSYRPDYVIVDGGQGGSAAADSLLIDTEVIQAASEIDVKKLINLASFEVYPEKCQIPFKEEALSQVKLQNEENPYRIAKLTALKQCKMQNGLRQPRFLFCVYPYLCGAHDTGFDIRSAHPVKNIASRIVKAKTYKKDFAVVSNDGDARYQLMAVYDLASAVVYLMEAPVEHDVINISYDTDIKIDQIALFIKGHLNFKGKLIFDLTSYDAVPRLFLNNNRLKELAWTPSSSVQDGIKETVLWLESTLPPEDHFKENSFILP